MTALNHHPKEDTMQRYSMYVSRNHAEDEGYVEAEIDSLGHWVPHTDALAAVEAERDAIIEYVRNRVAGDDWPLSLALDEVRQGKHRATERQESAEDPDGAEAEAA